MGKYTLKQGENIWDVASLYGTTAEELARLNNTNDPFSIRKNMTINVPDLDVGKTASAASEGDGGNSGGVVMPNKPVANYNTTSWNNTAKGKEAWGAYEAARDKVTNYEYSNQKQLDEIMNSILNRDKFNYNFNEDAFYQMYKDKYHKQGKMAAANVMGQAAAMTGGYGNSYAATVGNQAYQASLQNLNDIIPELYQMAYDKYNQEGQDLYNKYGLLNSDYEREYGQLMDILGIRKSDYYDGSNIYYNDVSLQNQAEEARYKSALAEYEAALEAINQGEDNAYRDNRDRVEDEKWLAEYIAKYGFAPKDVIPEDVTPKDLTPEDVTPESDFPNVDPSIITRIQQYTDKQSQANYIASLGLDEETSLELLDKYGIKDVDERNWEVVDYGGRSIGIDRDAEIRDVDTGEEYTLEELFEELKKTMKPAEARKKVKELQVSLGISGKQKDEK